jgi:hypothetical protein
MQDAHFHRFGLCATHERKSQGGGCGGRLFDEDATVAHGVLLMQVKSKTGLRIAGKLTYSLVKTGIDGVNETGLKALH